MYKETLASLISKEELEFLKDDEGFAKFIIKQLSQGLSDKLMTILDKENEVIVRQSELNVSEYKPTNSVEYRRQIEWSPLVRCKDCIHRHQTTCPFLIANAYKASSDDDFCSRGERREDVSNC